MTAAAPDAKPSPLAGLWLGVQRERALIALFELGRQHSFALRAARLYAFGVGFGYAVAIASVRSGDRHTLVQGFVHAALIALSWVVGALAALGTAQVLAKHADRDALVALALQRGVSRASLTRARLLAGAVRIARLIGMPALCLVAVGVARGCSVGWALAVAPALVVYASALGLSLACLAHFSAELAPRHPRAMLAALVLAPVLISAAYPGLPSLPGLFSGLLERLLDTGAQFS